MVRKEDLARKREEEAGRMPTLVRGRHLVEEEEEKRLTFPPVDHPREAGVKDPLKGKV